MSEINEIINHGLNAIKSLKVPKSKKAIQNYENAIIDHMITMILQEVQELDLGYNQTERDLVKKMKWNITGNYGNSKKAQSFKHAFINQMLQDIKRRENDNSTNSM